MLQTRLVVFKLTVPVENSDIGIPPAKGNRRCLRFQTPDLQLQIQDEDLTYVSIPAPRLQCWTEA